MGSNLDDHLVAHPHAVVESLPYFGHFVLIEGGVGVAGEALGANVVFDLSQSLVARVLVVVGQIDGKQLFVVDLHASQTVVGSRSWKVLFLI